MNKWSIFGDKYGVFRAYALTDVANGTTREVLMCPSSGPHYVWNVRGVYNVPSGVNGANNQGAIVSTTSTTQGHIYVNTQPRLVTSSQDDTLPCQLRDSQTTVSSNDIRRLLGAGIVNNNVLYP